MNNSNTDTRDTSSDSRYRASPNWNTIFCCGVTRKGEYCGGPRQKDLFCQYKDHANHELKSHKNKLNSSKDIMDDSIELLCKDSPNWEANKSCGLIIKGKQCKAPRRKESFYCQYDEHREYLLNSLPLCSPTNLRRVRIDRKKIYENHEQIDIYTGDKIDYDYEIDHIFECQLGALAINQTFKLPSSTHWSDQSVFATKSIVKEFINHDNNLAPTSKYINQLKCQGIKKFCDDMRGNNETRQLLTYLEDAKTNGARGKLKRKESINIRKELYVQCKRAQSKLNDNGDSGMFVESCSEIIQKWIPILKLNSV